MRVMKFGGTSVGSPERMKHVAQLIRKSGAPVFVVLSAMSGTTNALVEISRLLYCKKTAEANELIDQLERKYLAHVPELYSTEKYASLAQAFISEEIALLRSFTKELFTSFEEKTIVAQGELLSTNMLTLYLLEQGVNVTLLSALDFMRIDKNGEPNAQYIQAHLLPLIASSESDIFITQGFICRNAYNEIDNLQRGGSDYTASLVGAALKAEEIQIWTDIDGMHNNDPRIVRNTSPIRQLSFEEAAELAYFGAKILHPTCVQPAKSAGIPVRLLNTMEPETEGTIVNNTLAAGKMKAVAAKDNVSVVKVEAPHTVVITDFLRKLFDIFETYNTPIDMLATSEMGISVSIDKDKHLNDIVEELQKYGAVSVEGDMCIVCVVGDLDWKNVGFEALALSALKDIPVRMIAYGGSAYSISFLIRKADKARALQSLSDTLFINE